LLTRNPLRALLDTEAFRRRHGVFPRVPGRQHRGTRPPTGPAAAAGVHRAPGRGGGAGIANATPRSVGSHGPALRHRRAVFLADDLFACQPIAAVQRAGGNFIFTCKPAPHQTITEYLTGAELEEHRKSVVAGGKRTTTIYRWLPAGPMRATDDALIVNWFSIEILNAVGKRTYHNSFITDLPVTAGTVAELAACGRARWKIENETFNVLKTNGYNLEHNFGHGKETLASVLVTLNLLAFAFHTTARLAVLAWREAVIARGAAYRFFERLRTVTA
jgi:hypothetical protein